MKDYNFCHICGQKLIMFYLGNDPENGPALPRCSDQSHDRLDENIPLQWEFAIQWLQDLAEYNETTPWEEDKISNDITAAAERILKWYMSGPEEEE